MFVGISLIVVAGVMAYPSIRGWFGLDVAPEGFGDEAALSASIVESSESLPPNGGQPEADAPLVLPETPLQIEPTPSPEVSATFEPTPLPTSEPTSLPTVVPVSPTPAPVGFVPDEPSRIVIPAISLDAPVKTVGWSLVTLSNGQQANMWDVPNERAAGWLKTSAKVGEGGNIVLDGHHNVAGEVFRYLVDLKEGDAIQLWVGDQTRDYVVSLLKILPEKGQPISVRLENAKWMQPTDDERLTLVTCWPYENNTHRLIVVALPADAQPRAGDLGAE